MNIELEAITRYLDRRLKIDAFEDISNNGLQVANEGRVGKVCCAVDASLETIEAAAEHGADLLICHHGISWGDSLKRITDLTYGRVAALIRNDIALYACHLPLDAHPTLGNNAGICRALGLRNRRPFGVYHGVTLGFSGTLPRPMRYETFEALARKRLGVTTLQTMAFGPRTVRTVGVVSGGAADLVADAGRAGLDVYLSGEPKLEAYSLAQEYGIHAVFAGHYATEVFGVRSLATLVRKQFKLPVEFLAFDIPF